MVGRTYQLVKLRRNVRCDRNVNFRCSAQLHVTIKLVTRSTRKKDKLVGQYPCIVNFQRQHNHSLRSAEALAQLKLTKNYQATLHKYFDSGLSAGQVHKWLQMDMVPGDLTSMANNHYYPKRSSLYFQWNLWKKNNFCNYTESEMLEAILACAKTVPGKIEIKKLNDNNSFARVILTPFMIRVHSEVSQANEIVFNVTPILSLLNTVLSQRIILFSPLQETISSCFLIFRGGHFRKSVRKSANCGLKFLFADLRT